MAGVYRGIRQAAQGIHELLPRQSFSVGQRFSLYQFSQARSGSDGRYASAHTVPDLIDSSIGEGDGESHDVATGGILHAHFGIGFAQIACIARILEMIKHRSGVTHVHPPPESVCLKTPKRLIRAWTPSPERLRRPLYNRRDGYRSPPAKNC